MGEFYSKGLRSSLSRYGQTQRFEAKRGFVEDQLGAFTNGRSTFWGKQVNLAFVVLWVKHDLVIFVFVLLKRQSDQSVEMNRLLERNIKQSRCLDVESLCIRAGEKVWQIRVDLNVLNHDGNILDCANMALIASLAHFKLPEVSVTGDEIKIVNLFFLYSIRKRDGSLSNILTWSIRLRREIRFHSPFFTCR